MAGLGVNKLVLFKRTRNRHALVISTMNTSDGPVKNLVEQARSEWDAQSVQSKPSTLWEAEWDAALLYERKYKR